jgi:hypothetical protein
MAQDVLYVVMGGRSVLVATSFADHWSFPKILGNLSILF